MEAGEASCEELALGKGEDGEVGEDRWEERALGRGEDRWEERALGREMAGEKAGKKARKGE